MGFLQRLFGRRETPGERVAKDRWRFVLTQDRARISLVLLDALKDEIITVISRHVNIDIRHVQVSVTESGSESSLVADIPLRN